MRRVVGTGLLSLGMLGCGVDASNDEGSGPLREDGPIRIVREIAVAYEAEGEDFLYRPTDVVLSGDTIVVVDNGNDRLVLLDLELNVLGSIGRTGAGPGEFAAPVSVRVTPSEIIVAEIDNGRFSVFDRTGAFVRTIGDMALATEFALDSRGAMYRPAPSMTHHAYRVTEEGETLFAPRRDTVEEGPEWDAIMMGARESRVAVTAGDTMHVFNDTDGTLSKYAPDGTRLVTRELPGNLLDSLKAGRAALVNSLSRLGVNEYAATLIHSFATTERNEIIIALNAGNTVGLVVDPVTYRARRLTVPEMNANWAPLKTARAMALRDDRLYIVSESQLYLYEVDRSEGGMP
ncbi:MAG: hypothetical protein ACREL7_13500 [Longimicrobiales bacterium]